MIFSSYKMQHASAEKVVTQPVISVIYVSSVDSRPCWLPLRNHGFTDLCAQSQPLSSCCQSREQFADGLIKEQQCVVPHTAVASSLACIAKH